ncbi:hypothetical protein [Clostridium botulinum]|uniref:Uncharacterized protein n=1 Tax=Clostridium botulinum TaxID=1491 RepID=A0A9Q1UXG9_CLOBO|nr:hypothetical protein [Clostridium botulinum]AEB77423.1 hypothetical protein CbC4_5001 [Clostridium botulinum BKT015925]KEH96021.1 hypothetical protein Y848_p0001 [Clostridium botulinum C/D str. Sp77]KEH96989.1 hypothetical protein Z953_13400 [Clostridium botulinum D str. 16868]KLU74597.1 hypothetical protein CBC3_12925 [Clostridium botulinum V891]KOA75859.1 hypothetical protein ADU77_10395 [Clostridium botulinum]
MTINKSDYKILELLLEKQCTTEYKSLTVKEISNSIDLSISQVRNILKLLTMLNLIANGSKQGKQNTYYITTEGMRKIGENM